SPSAALPAHASTSTAPPPKPPGQRPSHATPPPRRPWPNRPPPPRSARTASLAVISPSPPTPPSSPPVGRWRSPLRAAAGCPISLGCAYPLLSRSARPPPRSSTPTEQPHDRHVTHAGAISPR